MGSDGARPRRSFWRRLRRALRRVLDVLDLVEFLAIVLRVVAAPFRLLLRLLDASW